MSIIDAGVTFNGRRIVHPGAYDAISVENTVTVTAGSLNRPIVLGQADSGTPGEVAWFSTSSSAKSYLKGGDIVTALDLMFSPAPGGGGGASMVGVLPVNSLVRATLVSGGLTFTAKEYGELGNRITAKLGAGTITNTKKVTLTRWDIPDPEVFDNLGAVIKIKYVPPEGDTNLYATLNVTVTDGAATALQIKVDDVTPAVTIDVDIDLTDARYLTVGDVARYIASFAEYDVSYTSGTLPSSAMTALSAVDIYDTYGYCLAVDADLAYQINALSNMVTVAVTGSVTTIDPAAYLAGGSKGTVPSDWTNYFTTLKTEFSDMLVILSSDATIHAAALAHVGQMELRGQKQILFTGGALSETASQAKARALVLNSSRAVLAYPGIKAKNSAGVIQTLAPYYAGAMLAGRCAGTTPSEPLTFDYFNLVSLEKDLICGDPEIDELISSGIACLETVLGGGVRLAQSVTTDLTPASPFKELSVRRGSDSLSMRVTRALEAHYVGSGGRVATIATVAQFVKDLLESSSEIVGYKDIEVSFVGTAVYVDFKVAYVEPINYVLVTCHFVSSTVA